MSALIVGTMFRSLEIGRDPDARIGVDAYEDEDRVDLIIDGAQTVALTRYEARKLARYLEVACSRGEGSQ
jgi:hypothetical protein